MKIVTYNVNGLRSRVAQHGSLLKLLNSLDADIICFQETKISKQDLSVDLTMAEGYEAFVSCTRTSKRGRLGYSGVATFCRVTSAFSSNDVALPLAAEEGFTGLLECSRKREAMNMDLLEIPCNVDGLENITNEDFLKVDSEGRCIITDHGHFVLFNLYGPRAEDDDVERLNFKLLFFKILQKRWESLLNEGRRVFVVGDLNIAPASIDKCDADPNFERNMFREWLRSLLRECQGPFFDVFRSKHPERKEAYTCFPQNVGAEEFNYGSRIDHILIAGPCLHQNDDMDDHNILDCHVKECDILLQFTRGTAANAPKWNGGRSTKLEGSDHVPVYVILNDVPNLPVHNTPPLSVRYIPEVRGWQQTIVSFLSKTKASSGSKCNVLPNLLLDKNTTICSGSALPGQDFGAISKLDMTSSVSQYLCEDHLTSNSEVQSLCVTNEQLSDNTENTMLRLGSLGAKSVLKCDKRPRKKNGHSTCSQLTLRSFFQRPKALINADLKNVKSDNSPSQANTRQDGDESSCVSQGAACDGPTKVTENDNRKMNESDTIRYDEDQPVTNTCPSKRESDNVAIFEWQRIQQKMKKTIPLCRGHGEPCVARDLRLIQKVTASTLRGPLLSLRRSKGEYIIVRKFYFNCLMMHNRVCSLVTYPILS